jgi:hypothetical protein
MKKLALTFSLATLVCGCGASGDEDGAEPLGPPGSYPVLGCEHVDHRPCDVQDAPCRDRLMELAACLRGSEPMPVPPVTTITVAEYVTNVNAELAESPPPNPNHYERALGLLSLVSAGELSATMIRAEDVTLLGYYSFDEKNIVLIDHPDDEDELPACQTLLHEFVHALQDRDFALAPLTEALATTYDSYLGVRSIIEGEARMHETTYAASLLGLDPSAIDWDERYASVAERDQAYVLEGDAPYSDSWWFFPYALGSRFVHHAFRRSGADGVRELFESPPTRARGILASTDDVVVDDFPEPEFTAPEAPSPWTLWAEDTLGAWGIAMVMTRQGASEAARDLALDWRGDRLWIYADDATPPRTTMIWDVEYASREAAVAADALMGGLGASVVRSETRVLVARSTAPDPIDWALVP